MVELLDHTGNWRNENITKAKKIKKQNKSLDQGREMKVRKIINWKLNILIEISLWMVEFIIVIRQKG